jgi:POT family proton-dependent oligopeptide transporter
MGYGWHAGFGVAGFGMLIGLVVYLAGSRHLPADGRQAPADAAGAPRAALTASQKRRIWGLFALWPVGVAFWIAQSQIWNVYNVWVQDHIDMHIGSFEMPVPWLQSLDGLAPAVFTPITLWLWARMAARGKEPDEFVKLAFGVGLFGVSVAMLGAGPLFEGAAGKASVLLPVIFHVVSNFAAVWFAPVILAIFATRAPATWRGTLVGVNALSISAASVISGRMGSMYEHMTPTAFWLTNASICFAASLWVLVMRGFYRRMLARENAEDDAALPPKEEVAMDPAIATAVD